VTWSPDEYHLIERRDPDLNKKLGLGLVVWGNTCSLPETVPPAEVSLEKALEMLSRPNTPQVLATDPATNLPIIFKQGKYGPYLQLGEEGTKKVGLSYGPKNIPITKLCDINNLTAEDALKLMELPRTLGEDNGEKITTSSGRFGPYVKKGQEFRSLPKDKDVLTVTLEEAKQIFATPKAASRRAKAEVLRELGEDPKSKKKIQILNGRYGPYISNGSRTFVSLPKDSTPEDISLEQAITMLENKKGRGRKKKKE
jgi:DNA topoisomerase-1